LASICADSTTIEQWIKPLAHHIGAQTLRTILLFNVVRFVEPQGTNHGRFSVYQKQEKSNAASKNNYIESRGPWQKPPECRTIGRYSFN